MNPCPLDWQNLMESADYPNLKRYRVKRIDGQFLDAEEQFANEYSVGGLEILSEKLLPETWTVYTSGIDILISESYQREWQPVANLSANNIPKRYSPNIA